MPFLPSGLQILSLCLLVIDTKRKNISRKHHVGFTSIIFENRTSDNCFPQMLHSQIVIKKQKVRRN